jgi:hypothetical protein
MGILMMVGIVASNESHPATAGVPSAVFLPGFLPGFIFLKSWGNRCFRGFRGFSRGLSLKCFSRGLSLNFQGLLSFNFQSLLSLKWMGGGGASERLAAPSGGGSLLVSWSTSFQGGARETPEIPETPVAPCFPLHKHRGVSQRSARNTRLRPHPRSPIR